MDGSHIPRQIQFLSATIDKAKLDYAKDTNARLLAEIQDRLTNSELVRHLTNERAVDGQPIGIVPRFPARCQSCADSLSSMRRFAHISV